MRTLEELEQGHLKTGALSGMILSYTQKPYDYQTC
jgi:hypothetical protein